MGQILAIVNQKGGVGKTTTTVNLAAYLAKNRKKTLLLDADPQGNSTSGIGKVKKTLEMTSYDVLINQTPIRDVILETGRKHLYLCPSNINLAGAEVELVDVVSRETRLKRALEPIQKEYDFILIDCPPSLGLITINALTAATGVLVPIQSEYYALEGLTQLMETVNLVRQQLNPGLDIFGVLMTMYDKRTQLARQVAQDVQNVFGEKVFKSIIPRNVRLSEAPSFGLTILEYDKKSKGSAAYSDLAREVIKRAGR
ncbi:MAG: ParA family protein [Clostridiaceae bacterium]|nr:ParA family protein [Clostridiaceae bacterium]